MGIELKKLISSVIACMVLFGSISAIAAPTEGEAPAPECFDLPCTVDTVMVGLSSGSSAVSEARLVNKVGSGYLFGYFDFSREFHELGNTGCGNISIRGDTGYELEAGDHIGPWHLLINNRYDSFEEAKADAKVYWGGFPAYIDGEYRVLVGAYDDESKADKARSKRNIDAVPFTGSDTAVLVSESDTWELLFLLDSKGNELAVRADSDDIKGETWYSGDAYYGDFRFSRSADGITVVNYVDLEDYVKGVLPYEMHGDWPEDALMAQAACARTYAINKLNEYSDKGFDVRNDTYSQVYRGITGTTDSTNEASAKTAGQFVRYDGVICKVYYMSSDGGATDSGANVFGENRPYLCGTKDSNEDSITFYNKTWRSELLASNIQHKLSRHDIELGEITDIKGDYSEHDNVIALHFTDAEGKTADIYGEDCFRVLSLDSLRYKISSYTADNGSLIFVFEGKGWGHNCGLSQWGAYSMAYNHKANSNDIIGFYFNGAYIG